MFLLWTSRSAAIQPVLDPLDDLEVYGIVEVLVEFWDYPTHIIVTYFWIHQQQGYFQGLAGDKTDIMTTGVAEDQAVHFLVHTLAVIQARKAVYRILSIFFIMIFV